MLFVRSLSCSNSAPVPIVGDHNSMMSHQGHGDDDGVTAIQQQTENFVYLSHPLRPFSRPLTFIRPYVGSSSVDPHISLMFRVHPSSLSIMQGYAFSVLIRETFSNDQKSKADKLI
jgi:hypothetical protein